MSRKANYQLWIDEAVNKGKGKELIDWFKTYRISRPLPTLHVRDPEELKTLISALIIENNESGQNLARKIRAAWIQKSLRDTRPEKAQTFVLSEKANQKVSNLAMSFSTYKNLIVEQAIDSFYSDRKELSKIIKNKRTENKDKQTLLIQNLEQDKKNLSKALADKEDEICKLKTEIEKQSEQIGALTAKNMELISNKTS